MRLIMERESGLKFNHDFVCGYSPEGLTQVINYTNCPR